MKYHVPGAIAASLLLCVGAVSAAEPIEHQRALLAGTVAQPSVQYHSVATSQSTQDATQRVLLGVTARAPAQAASGKRARLDQQVLSQRVLLGTRERG